MTSISPETLKANYLGALKAEHRTNEAKEAVRWALEQKEQELKAARKLTCALGNLLDALGMNAERDHADQEARVWAGLHNTDVPPLTEAPPEGDGPARIASFDAEVEE